MPLAPQYWISQADRLRTEDVPAVLNGFLTERADYRLAEMLHGGDEPAIGHDDGPPFVCQMCGDIRYALLDP
jgi:hypothetical protein